MGEEGREGVWKMTERPLAGVGECSDKCGDVRLGLDGEDDGCLVVSFKTNIVGVAVWVLKK